MQCFRVGFRLLISLHGAENPICQVKVSRHSARGRKLEQIPCTKAKGRRYHHRATRRWICRTTWYAFSRSPLVLLTSCSQWQSKPKLQVSLSLYFHTLTLGCASFAHSCSATEKAILFCSDLPKDIPKVMLQRVFGQVDGLLDVCHRSFSH